MLKYVMPGNKIVISKLRKKGSNQSVQQEEYDSEYSYISQVEDILNSEELVAAVTISKGRLAKLPPGMRFQYVIHTKHGMIMFTGKIMEYMQEDGNFLMRVHFIGEGEIFQRREFYRFACYLPFSFAPLSDDEEEDVDNFMLISSMKQGEIRDLSGGGIRFVSNEVIADDTKIRCALDLGDDLIITVGRVLNSVKSEDRRYDYEYRVIFIGILKTDQERIIRYIFNEQRRQLKALR
jgi:c-di-GMP-binding flagellar brake protein YcgR